MSVYNMLFGVNPDSKQLLEILNLTDADLGRFRDIFVEDDYIVIHTRNGGGNRDDYQWVFDEMSTHPWYSHDVDDDFDCTYANIYFRVPEDKIQTFVSLLNQGHNPKETWQALFKALER